MSFFLSQQCTKSSNLNSQAGWWSEVYTEHIIDSRLLALEGVLDIEHRCDHELHPPFSDSIPIVS